MRLHVLILPVFSLVLAGLLGSRLHADDAAVARRLEALGGKVTVKEGSATEVAFTDCSGLGDAEFRLIGDLTRLKTLTLYGHCRGLDDTTVVHLARLEQLESLGTDGAQFSDEGLRHLGALKNLKSASFFHTSFGNKDFTGVGFGHLKACPKLERLTVAGISMGDAGLAAVATITQLRELRTWHTYQTEAGNREIARLANLERLHIGQRLPHAGAKAPSLSDESLAVFAAMKNLQSLELGEAHFTVAALRALKGLPKLAKLGFFETDLSTAEVEELRRDLPGVTIDWKPLTPEQRKKFDQYLPK